MSNFIVGRYGEVWKDDQILDIPRLKPLVQLTRSYLALTEDGRVYDVSKQKYLTEEGGYEILIQKRNNRIPIVLLGERRLSFFQYQNGEVKDFRTSQDIDVFRALHLSIEDQIVVNVNGQWKVIWKVIDPLMRGIDNDINSHDSWIDIDSNLNIDDVIEVNERFVRTKTHVHIFSNENDVTLEFETKDALFVEIDNENLIMIHEGGAVTLYDLDNNQVKEINNPFLINHLNDYPPVGFIKCTQDCDFIGRNCLICSDGTAIVINGDGSINALHLPAHILATKKNKKSSATKI